MNKFYKKISVYHWIALSLGFLIATILWAIYHTDMETTSSKSLEEYCKHQFSYNMMVDLDKLSPDKTDISESEKIEIIRAQQLLVLNQQAELVNDFRQEMNNNINKMNTWLAFAIGVMSVIGVFIPVILQFKLNSEYKEKARRLEIEIKKNSKEAINKLNAEVNTIQAKFDETKDNFERDLHLQHLLVNFLSFKHGCDDNILQNQPDRDLLMRFVWCKAVDSFDKVVKDCLEDIDHTEESRARLLISFLMMYSMVEKIKSSLHTRRVRELNSITAQIKDIIVEIELGQRNMTMWGFTKNKIDEVCASIQKLSSIFN